MDIKALCSMFKIRDKIRDFASSVCFLEYLDKVLKHSEGSNTRTHNIAISISQLCFLTV